MSTMTRNDIHAPSSVDFDPEAYDCHGVYDLKDPFDNKPRVMTVSRLVEQGHRFTSPHGSEQCGHCGTRIRYAALMVHRDTKGMIYVGETCLDNRFSATRSEFDALRKAAAAKAEESRRLGKAHAFLAEHPEAAYFSYAHNISVAGGVTVYYPGTDWDSEYRTYEEALAAVPDWYKGAGDVVGSTYKRGTTWDAKVRMGDKTSTLMDMWGKIQRYGSLSDNALAYGTKIMGWLDEAEQRLQAREAETAAKVAQGITAPEGRVVVEGTVVSTRWQESQFGSTQKMLVVHEDGWKVWSTVPSSIDVEKGTKVRFTATLERKAGDPLFAIAKRPSKAEVL